MHSQAIETTLLSKTPQNSRFGIKSSNVILENYCEPKEAIVLIQSEIIHDVIVIDESDPKTLAEIQENWDIKDYGNLIIFPGLVDSNVHLHADFDHEWENIVHCTSLAASGGVTTIIDNPVMCSPFDSGEEYVIALHKRIKMIQEKSKVDFGIYGLLEPKTKDSIQGILEAGVVGLKSYLLNCFQHTIGHFPEDIERLIQEIETKYPGLLLVLHPEVATERELFLTSPCRAVSLEKRLDMGYDIKSIDRTGAANKGSYLDDLTGKDEIDEEEDDKNLALSPNSPSKLGVQVRKLKEKTEVDNIVQFELLSYSFNNDQVNSKNHSAHEFETNFLEQLALEGKQKILIKTGTFENKIQVQIHNKTSEEQVNVIKKGDISGKEEGKEMEKDVDLNKMEIPEILRNDSRGLINSPKKKSLFARSQNGEIKLVQTRASQNIHPLGNIKDSRSQEIKENNLLNNKERKAIEIKISMCMNKSDQESKTESQSSEGDTSPTLSSPSQSGTLQIGFSFSLKPAEESSCLENKIGQKDANQQIKQNKDAEGREIQTQENLTPHFPNKRSSFLSRRLNVNHLTLDTSLGQNSPPLLTPDGQSGTDGKSQNNSPTILNKSSTPISSLLQRRLSRNNSNSTVSSPELKNNGSRRNSLELAKPLIEHSIQKEIKYSHSYSTFLANRPQSWEENSVTMILSALKPDTNLRIMLHNLSLASSFLKVRRKKKSNEELFNKVFGDTSPAYLFFNDKTVKAGETKYKTSPPFRNKENQNILKENLKLGGIDILSSYHFFTPSKFKLVDEGNFRRAMGGLDCMGCSLQATWTALYCHQQSTNTKFSNDAEYYIKTINIILKQMYKSLCSNPAQVLKISHRKGTISKNKDADFVIWNPFEVEKNFHLGNNHVFQGKPLLGKVVKTYLRGNVIYNRDNYEDVNSKCTSEFIKPTF